MQHCSTLLKQSSTVPGVSYLVRTMTFGRRLEMMRAVKELARRLEFHAAGSTVEDQAEGGILAFEISKLYLTWGLAKIYDLEIDGSPATPDSLIENGPEPLCQEILTVIKAECFLSEEERKN